MLAEAIGAMRSNDHEWYPGQGVMWLNNRQVATAQVFQSCAAICLASMKILFFQMALNAINRVRNKVESKWTS